MNVSQEGVLGLAETYIIERQTYKCSGVVFQG